MSTTERDRKFAEVHRLRAEGKTWKEITAATGVPRATASQWVNDPTGEQTRRRKAGYRGTCEDCGGPTDGSNGRRGQPRRCRACQLRHQHEDRRWTREVIVEAFLRFNREVGRPPRACDLNPWLAERYGLSDASERRARFSEGWLPHLPTVQREFGSFNKAVEGAGLRPYDEALDRDWGPFRPRVSA